MNKIFSDLLIIIMVLPGISCSDSKKASSAENDDALGSGNEPKAKQIQLADPTIFYQNGTYYLYGTSQGELTEKGLGFLVFSSDDMENWEGPLGKSDGFALTENNAFGNKGFWAPQVFEYDDKFYMAYTANESIAIATSDSPLGPFTNSGEALYAESKQIDPFIFFDDGKAYLYHVRLDEGNRIFVAEMEGDLKSIKPETLRECLSATKHWENTALVDWPVAEGPTVIKHNKKYYLIYSANDFRNPDYAVGYATSDSPLGPWKKSDENPTIHRELLGESGPGHGDVIIGENDEMHYVLHTHFSHASVHPRRTAVIQLSFAEDEDGNEFLQAEEETFSFLKLK
ncbi:glycoside hydrolase family 43 protein [Salegentibacter sp. JZCK2]|uniref:glycoside hydrolase family 43 protein n=1 Tax=Salegentibacter tibetensis TaxID=2873600 RepID=UPI001CD03B28|nr:glycoside hydrolase family 43 protein [Salegentibacter tibetensis]MBZ9731233.1 glycoside hydrolase family 43 protein [Salegentibacter tibetensis]